MLTHCKFQKIRKVDHLNYPSNYFPSLNSLVKGLIWPGGDAISSFKISLK